MFLENDILRSGSGVAAGPSIMDPLSHHISPPGGLTGARLSPQYSLSDIDEFGHPLLPGLDPNFQPSSAISICRR